VSAKCQRRDGGPAYAGEQQAAFFFQTRDNTVNQPSALAFRRRAWAISSAALLTSISMGLVKTAVGQTVTPNPPGDLTRARQIAADPAPPATQGSGRSNQDVVNDLQSTEGQLRDVLTTPDTITDPAKRMAAAPQATPLLRKMLADFDDLAAMHPAERGRIAQTQEQFLAFLSVMGDQDAGTRLTSMAGSTDTDESIHGQAGQLLARWILAGQDAAAQTRVVDDLEKLDRQFPQSISLTVLTDTARHAAVSDDLRQRLAKLITDVLSNPAATAAQRQLADEQKLKTQENKPVVITGATLDAKPFTTASWKGKVILVDFWAVWCVPCLEELPRLKRVYSKYHDQGLEVVGVDNDFKSDRVRDFIQKNDMPWPELFDPDAALAEQWNAVTLGFGISTIPTRLLIDKKGVLRSVEGREKMEDLIPKLLAEPE
jgi:thiol-disulfide isomerase/thioredoxin